MTIKKPINSQATAATVAPGGATIADRFKLDMPDPNAQKAGLGKGGTAATVAGLIALVVIGVLAYMLYDHWNFLMPA